LLPWHLQSMVVVISDTAQPWWVHILLNALNSPLLGWVTTKSAGRGTGLGLSITRDLITALGGSIAVTTSAAHGTTFTIELPVAGTPAEVL